LTALQRSKGCSLVENSRCNRMLEGAGGIDVFGFKSDRDY